ncbi:receptor activity-modifying protein 3-like [Megalops cyprinoides]|uniref:receptor activity-modifying protein 3-like n=1 Tax=Megalops cyprinoides TaxID=118141 RepID=UPI0018647109|nr:receptor activity-modifying protein 3-like [Megalops cyprinoides]
MNAKSCQIVMDKNVLVVFKLFVVGILVNTLMASGLSATEHMYVLQSGRPQMDLCNETDLLLEMEVCSIHFRLDMARVDPQYWCNLTHIIREYDNFSACTEAGAIHLGCYWPNPLVESYIIGIHRDYFSNCTLERVVWVDPPDDTLAALIVAPVFLTLAMIALVVWRSKRGDVLA